MNGNSRSYGTMNVSKDKDGTSINRSREKSNNTKSKTSKN